MQLIHVYEIPCQTCKGNYLTMSYQDLYSRIREEIGDSKSSDFGEAAKNLRFHDIWKMDFVRNQTASFSVKVRKHVVLITMDPVRVIITASTLAIIVPPMNIDATIIARIQVAMTEWSISRQHEIAVNYSAHSQLAVTELNAENLWSQQGNINLTFEMQAYEAIMDAACALLVEEDRVMQKRVHETLTYMRRNALLTLAQQENFRALKLLLAKAKYKISMYCKAFNDLLDEEELLAIMNLSLLQDQPNLYQYPLQPALLTAHETLVGLLSPYLMDLSAVNLSLSSLTTQLLDAEEAIGLRLNIMENVSLTVNKELQTLNVAIMFSNCVTAVGGMNLTHSTPRGSFLSVLLISLCIIPLNYKILSMLLHKRNT